MYPSSYTLNGGLNKRLKYDVRVIIWPRRPRILMMNEMILRQVPIVILNNQAQKLRLELKMIVFASGSRAAATEMSS